MASAWQWEKRTGGTPVHQLHPCSREVDGTSLSEPVCFGGHGRGPSAWCGLLREPESRACPLVGHAADWAWSSVRAHLTAQDDGLVSVRPVLDRVSCFADLLLEDKEEAFAALRRAESTGRPLGTAEFVSGLERLLGRRLARRAPGPAPAVKDDARQMRLLD